MLNSNLTSCITFYGQDNKITGVHSDSNNRTRRHNHLVKSCCSEMKESFRWTRRSGTTAYSTHSPYKQAYDEYVIYNMLYYNAYIW